MASYTNHGMNTPNSLLRTDSSEWPPPRMVTKTCINRKQLINKDNNQFITIVHCQFHSQQEALTIYRMQVGCNSCFHKIQTDPRGILFLIILKVRSTV
jgi:hypothetical protein